MSARRQFLGEGHPPVFADVGEGKELWAGRVYAGEALDLRRKWKFENGKLEEDRAGRRKWKFENGKLEERRNAYKAEDAEDTLRLGTGQAENAEEAGKVERGGMVGRRIRIWEGIWAMALETWREMVERTARGRRRRENVQKDI
jgi:hypothetical protein